MIAKLTLVKTDKSGYFLQGTGDPSRNADFSLYDLDGEGGDPFALGNTTWEIVSGIESAEYDPEDTDTFWEALTVVLESAIAHGIEIPDYAREAAGLEDNDDNDY